MKIVEKEKYPATWTALAYLHLDNDPRPLPETLGVPEETNLDRIEVVLATLQRTEVSQARVRDMGLGTRPVEDDLCDCELYTFVAGDEDEQAAIQARNPDFELANTMLEKIFDGEVEGWW